ncbi:MAG: signal recognition particle-docking protein FtsY [Verrucomicrobiota bacterium]|nr:signal recognition particle-docking protein FtsY [Verrucomicrobiota bacterium]
MSLFKIFKKGLKKTKTSLTRNLKSVFSGSQKWTEESYDYLEAVLIGTDMGVVATSRLVNDVRDRYEQGDIATVEDIMQIAEADVKRLLSDVEYPEINMQKELTIVMMIGVNGSGKTTTAAKLAHLWKQEGKKVVLAACDTFRAAAVEQLKIWGKRAECPVIAAQHGADAASVAFDAVSAAKNRNADVLIIDTAGRQHTDRGLMNELAKIRRILNKTCPGAPHETWLVIDGSTGTNALIQAREFGKYCDVSGLCLTKIDGSGKGGVVIAIHEEHKFPIRFLGLGEGMEDLQPFDPEFFAKALFE